MSEASVPHKASPLPPVARLRLADVLHRASMRLVLLAVLLVGASLFVLSLIALRFYMLDNLVLSARSIAYAVEASVVFNDRSGATEALAALSEQRPIALARVIDRDGDELARWQPALGSGGLDGFLGALFFPEPVVVPIRHAGLHIGEVQLRGAGGELAVFLLIALGCGLLSLGLCTLVALRFSRRTSESIAEPLRNLAEAAARARRERHFESRVELAGIAELHALDEDFNALLAELEHWQAQMDSHHQRLTYQANHDPLTGLANRAHFEAALHQALAAVRQHGGQAALFFIDADRFKSINDQLGHEVGDIVLCAIARRLRAKVRESDLVARLGGDEFAVLLYPLGDALQAGRIAAAMIDSMVEPIELPSGASLSTSLSIGIAFYPEHADDAAGLLKQADAAMYLSKRAGRGVYSVAPEAEVPSPRERRK